MKYDLIIIGAGPAGMTASIFACRAGLKVACFEQTSAGGNVGLAYKIDNYPGLPAIDGFELSSKMEEHAVQMGVDIKYEKVLSLEKDKRQFLIKTRRDSYYAKKVILSCGSKAKSLGLKNEDSLIGRGISYCASCDGNFYKDKTVAVVGGGYTALSDVNYLSNLAKKVYLINRSDRFRFSNNELEILKGKSNIEILTNATVEELFGKDKLEGISVKVGEDIKKLKIDGLFVAIGQVPNLDFVKLNLKLDEYGYVIVKQDQSTNIKNLYACGDVTNIKLKQIVTACASGAVAADSCIGG